MANDPLPLKPIKPKYTPKPGDVVTTEGYDFPFTVEEFDEQTYTCSLVAFDGKVLLRLTPVCPMSLTPWTMPA